MSVKFILLSKLPLVLRVILDWSAAALWPIYCFLMVHESETMKRLRKRLLEKDIKYD